MIVEEKAGSLGKTGESASRPGEGTVLTTVGVRSGSLTIRMVVSS
jgi:hypothetical protein